MLKLPHIALISHSSKIMLKMFQTRLQQYANHELPDVQAGFRKGRGTSDQIANIRWIIEKVREFQKNIYFCFIDYAKAFESITTNKASGGDRIPVELFQILKDDVVKVSVNLENSTVATGLEKVSFHSNPKERQCQRMLKLPHSSTHLTR